ncbi:MAG: hypothetical protein OXU73_00005 [Candidatus Campbellbacteria bacterium]|nr:hypothetical protein [Candidatus Campbellbacteria bacterium]
MGRDDESWKRELRQHQAQRKKENSAVSSNSKPPHRISEIEGKVIEAESMGEVLDMIETSRKQMQENIISTEEELNNALKTQQGVEVRYYNVLAEMESSREKVESLEIRLKALKTEKKMEDTFSIPRIIEECSERLKAQKRNKQNDGDVEENGGW